MLRPHVPTGAKSSDDDGDDDDDDNWDDVYAITYVPYVHFVFGKAFI